MKSQFSIKGNVKLYSLPAEFTFNDFQKLDNKEKYLVDEGDNLVVDTGMIRIANLMTGTSTVSWTLCGVGSGTNTPVSTDTALQTSIGTNTINDRYRAGLNVYFNTFFAKADENGTWTETCLLTSDSIMLCRRLFSAAFTKDTTKAAVVAWTLTLSAVAD